MSYATGTANSLTDLLTALRNACVAAGWTLSGDVLHKGTCYAEVKIGTLGETGAPANGMIFVRPGNGKDGSNNLTDPATAGTGCGIGTIRAVQNVNSYPDWDWPVSYHIHVHASPDEVFLLVNYGGATKWQYLTFGQSPAPGCAGTGNWAASTVAEARTTGSYQGEDTVCASPNGTGPSGYYSTRTGVGPFWFLTGWGSTTSYGQAPFYFHGAVEFTTGAPVWSGTIEMLQSASATTTYQANRTISACPTGRYPLSRTPNAWNGETLLVPIQLVSSRADFKVSLVGRLAHIRMCRNDFIEDGAVITLGPDKWKVYPCFKKNTEYRDGYVSGSIGPTSGHSGTMAMAIRYDGP